MLKIMLKNLKKVGALTLIFLLTAFPVSTQADVSEVENVKNSVVRIHTVDSAGDGWIGSGFYIGKKDGYQYYVTNDHVVSIDEGDIKGRPTGRILASASEIVFSDLYTTTDRIEAEPVYQTFQKGIDLAVVRIPDTGEEKRTPITLKSCENVAITDTVYVLGFPAAVDHLSADRMIALESTPDDVIVTKGNVSNAKFVFNSTDVVVIDAGVNGGNSGGPVVDEKGNVIGIATWGSNETETINMAIQSDELIKILEEKGFPYNTSSSSTATQTTEKQTKTSKNSEKKSNTPVFDGINEKTKTNLYILLGVLIFFVLVLVLVIIIVMMKKSNKKKNPKNNDWKNQNKRSRL